MLKESDREARDIRVHTEHAHASTIPCLPLLVGNAEKRTRTSRRWERFIVLRATPEDDKCWYLKQLSSAVIILHDYRNSSHSTCGPRLRRSNGVLLRQTRFHRCGRHASGKQEMDSIKSAWWQRL